LRTTSLAGKNVSTCTNSSSGRAEMSKPQYFVNVDTSTPIIASDQLNNAINIIRVSSVESSDCYLLNDLGLLAKPICFLELYQ
jgi:hypothetical protein